MERLFIIGNGFDIVHDKNPLEEKKTTYKAFRRYLIEDIMETSENKIRQDLISAPEGTIDSDGSLIFNKQETAAFLTQTIDNIDKNWNEFETDLGILELDDEMVDLDYILDKEGDPDYWAIADLNESLSDNLKIPVLSIIDLFSDWINTIDKNIFSKKDSFDNFLTDNDLFLTFNYTNVLEDLYDVPEQRICHIHGNQYSNIIVGHGFDEQHEDTTYSLGASDNLNEIHNRLRKDTKKAFKQHENFFTRLFSSEVAEIYSYGFSFSEVDRYYLQKIINNLSTGEITWFLHEYNLEEQRNQFISVLKELGFKGNFSTYSL